MKPDIPFADLGLRRVFALSLMYALESDIPLVVV
jgi:hypothetical protein